MDILVGMRVGPCAVMIFPSDVYRSYPMESLDPFVGILVFLEFFLIRRYVTFFRKSDLLALFMGE